MQIASPSGPLRDRDVVGVAGCAQTVGHEALHDRRVAGNGLRTKPLRCRPVKKSPLTEAPRIGIGPVPPVGVAVIVSDA